MYKIWLVDGIVYIFFSTRANKSYSTIQQNETYFHNLLSLRLLLLRFERLEIFAARDQIKSPVHLIWDLKSLLLILLL